MPDVLWLLLCFIAAPWVWCGIIMAALYVFGRFTIPKDHE